MKWAKYEAVHPAAVSENNSLLAMLIYLTKSQKVVIPKQL